MHFLDKGAEMIEFIIGQAGSGKTVLMTERIKAMFSGGGNECIIVPEQYSYEFDKMLYFRVGAERFNDLYSLTFTSLARQLFQLYGDPDRNGEYADDYDRMILIYQALASVRSTPGGMKYFLRQSTCGGFAESALKLIGDLKRSGITAEELFQHSALLDSRLMDKTSDIAAVYSEYERLMHEYGYKDNLDNIKKAAETAALHNWFKGKNVFIDEFESFTGDQLEMLKVIFSEAENVVITLKTDDVNAEEFTLFETVNNTYRKLAQLCREVGCRQKITSCDRSCRFRSPDLEYLSSHIMRDLPNKPDDAPNADNISIFEARDMYSEVEYVCASIKRMLCADKSLKYSDIAVISNNIETYADILKSASARYDIPYFLSIERSVSHTPIMVFVTTLLDILTARKIRSESVFRLMKCGILDLELTDVSALENYCTKWGIDGDNWCGTFRSADDELDMLEGLRSRIISPVMRLRSEVGHKHSAAEYCALIYDCLVECDAEKNTARLMGRLIKQQRDYDAAELKRIWACLIDILDSITNTLGDSIVTFSELSRIIRSMIGRITYSVPPQTVDSVTVASARTARLSAPRAVFVIGTTDGDFPAQVKKHDLFSEPEKQQLALGGLEISRPLSDLIASERLIVYKSLSAASEKLIITYPLADLSGAAKYPAQIIAQITDIFGSGRVSFITDSQLTTDYYAVTMHSAFYHYMQDRKLGDSAVSSIYSILLDDPEYKRRITDVLTRFGYKQPFTVDTETMERLKSFEPLYLSPTDVDKYNSCHFSYFCEKCLALKKYEEIALDARNEGSLIHSCFYNILSRHSKDEFVNLSESELKAEINRYSEKFLADTLTDELKDDARFAMSFRKITERLGKIFENTQRALSVSQFSPERFEMKLKGDSSVEMPFGNGHKLRFAGIIDRIDTWTDGSEKYLRIIDYKSSEKNITPEKLGGGINLQMLLYLFSVTDNNGLYNGYIPSGVLYSPVKVSSVTPSAMKKKSPDGSSFDTKLCPNGLVLSDRAVLNAMENGIGGKYIPAKLGKDDIIDEKSSVITSEGMAELKAFTEEMLTDMAESLLSGKIEAVPLVQSTNEKPCTYCDYGDICGNSNAAVSRRPDRELTKKAEAILSKKTEETEENHELD